MITNRYQFSQRSENNLNGVHPDLIKLARRALQLSSIDFAVTEGLRTAARQKYLFIQGKSETLKSRHLHGFAIDVFAFPTPAGSWEMKYYYQIAEAFKAASIDLGIPVEWGGDWQTFKDGPHFQLPHKGYPDP